MPLGQLSGALVKARSLLVYLGTAPMRLGRPGQGFDRGARGARHVVSASSQARSCLCELALAGRGGFASPSRLLSVSRSRFA